ncbi:MAG: TlpA family protein disulfide reductase [Bdellovibrionaceae bacterium]|nr:TlpA family protein disulfide reductase [Pseudobdellovibrionaceae bacterium]
MTQRAATLLGFGIVALFLLVLSLAPRFLKQTHFEAAVPGPTVGDSIDPATTLAAYNLPPEFAFAANDPTFKQSKRLPLASLFGDKDTLIINFWATWCAPCLDELPSLEQLNRRLRNANVGPRFLTISVDETTAPIDQLFKTLEFRPSFLVLHDPDGDFARQLGTTRFPETYWIDRNGKILHRWIGPQDWLSKEVVDKLAEPR